MASSTFQNWDHVTHVITLSYRLGSGGAIGSRAAKSPMHIEVAYSVQCPVRFIDSSGVDLRITVQPEKRSRRYQTEVVAQDSQTGWIRYQCLPSMRSIRLQVIGAACTPASDPHIWTLVLYSLWMLVSLHPAFIKSNICRLKSY